MEVYFFQFFEIINNYLIFFFLFFFCCCSKIIGLGCLGTPVVRTDAAAIWATGETWWQVPPITKGKLICFLFEGKINTNLFDKVELKGKLKDGVSGKDIIITLCGLFNKDEVLNHAGFKILLFS